MHDESPFDPCRQWLGIDAVELVTPHRVLGISPLETDPLVIVRAADQRLFTLRSIDPGPLARARDALLARIEQSRDAMLAAASAARGSPSLPFPATNHQPGGVFGSGAAVEPPSAPLFPAPGVVVRPRAVVRRSSPVLPLAVAALLLGAAGWLGYQVLQNQSGKSAASVALSTPPQPERPASERPRAVRQRRPAPEPITEQEPIADPEDEREPEPEPEPITEPEPEPITEPEPEPITEPEPESITEPEPETAASDGDTLEDHLENVYAALRRSDFPTADKLLDTAQDVAASDESASERLGRWRLLAAYARNFPALRDKALKASGENEIKLKDGRIIGIVEVDATRVVYRDRGRNERVPRDRLPDDVLLAIVHQWFNAARKPGNHLYLGTFHVLRDPPDLASAQGEFQLAAFSGEPDGTVLQQLLTDPVIAGGDQ
jgi:outer membrane biosynthesis protein TonB